MTDSKQIIKEVLDIKSTNSDIMNKLTSNKVDLNEYVNCVLQLKDI